MKKTLIPCCVIKVIGRLSKKTRLRFYFHNGHLPLWGFAQYIKDLGACCDD